MVDGPPDSVASASKPASSFERAGDRLRLVVELRSGETTIVSWKKLVREATSRKPNVPDPFTSCPIPEVNQLPISESEPQPSLPSAATAKPPAENEPKSSEAQTGSNRLSNVIEKIERLYAGNGSSDDEDVVLDDVPDDDEYDTEDSFIDDAELDDYFKVDKSTIKHDGFFVNRGKLERTEPTIATDQQPKKRRRKDGTRGQRGDGGLKQIKVGNKSRKSSSLVEKNAASFVHTEASAANAVEVSGKQKSAYVQTTTVPSGPPNSDGDRQDKGDDHKKNQLLLSLNKCKQKESSELRDTPAQRSNDRGAHGSKSHSGKQQINDDQQDQTIQLKQKVELSERFDLNVPVTRDSLQIMKTPFVARKDGSNVRSRITMLEKAIRELEKIVTESRPPSTEVQDTDPSSQGIKRRLPADIKQKLAKVARLAHESYGKIPKDVINRLMSIVGHLMQLRTLKRNLRVMANLGLSAKQEKDERLHKIKQEVTEMVKQRIPDIQSKFEQQMTNSDDFQETSLEGRETTLKRKYSMDDAIENKICDLYDLYIERIEEYSGPPVKRLYEELAALWPNGVMDIDGIKRAICKAKNRRKSLSGRRKEQNKIKEMLELRAGDRTRGEAINVQPLLHSREKLLSGSSNGTSPYSNSPVLAVAAPPQAVARSRGPSPSDSNTNKQRQEPGATDAMPKKKVKRQPIPETIAAESSIACPEEKSKHHNHMALPKASIQVNAPSASETPKLTPSNTKEE